jgi:molybdopterin molybdotransferase
MLNIEEATSIIQSNLYKPRTELTDIENAVGKVLAEIIYADRDFPPFNRVAMDGIAIQFNAFAKGKREFRIAGIQAAGDPQKKLNTAAAEDCLEIMTGAVLPVGADTIIRYEDIVIEGAIARLVEQKITSGQNIHRQGQDAKQGDILLEPGIILSPSEIALLASVGKSSVETYTFPKTAIVASGDELVEISSVPELHQIRRSNTYAIQAAMNSIHWPGKQYHLPDEENILRISLAKIVSEHDVIILSGGVSKGKFDFIPEVLEEMGIKKLFHQVSQRPGKPFWFGVSNDNKIVFALPGNPVSTYMCFYRYIEPWFWKSLTVKRKANYAVLGKDFTFQPNLTYFVQVRVENEEGRLTAYPDAGGGSGDFANLKNVDGFLELPLEKSTFRAGEAFPYFPFRH